MVPTFFDLWALVAVESFLWGAGTAIGELPPYFVARAARLAGERLKETKGAHGNGHTHHSDSEDFTDDDEAIGLGDNTSYHSGLSSPVDSSSSDSTPVNSPNGFNRRRRPKGANNLSLFERVKQLVVERLGHIGFFGILLFASIPNPLFDLAGLTCGHMLVPFMTFFSATLIGKAVVKVNLQTFFIISVFNKSILEALVKFIDGNIPFASGRARAMFDSMRKQYHRPMGDDTPQIAEVASKPIFTYAWDLFLGVMIAYFIMSIINSSVQEYLVNRDEALVAEYRLEHERDP